MDPSWDPHLQRIIGNASGNVPTIGTQHEDGKDQSFSTNYFTGKDSQQIPPGTGFSFGPSPMQRGQHVSGSGYDQSLNVRDSYDNAEHNRSSGYLVAPSEEPSPSAGFTFGPALRQSGQKVSPPSHNTNVRASYNIAGHDPLTGYLNRPSFELSQPIQRPIAYPTASNGNSQGRLSLPRFNSHIGSQMDSNSFEERKEPRVLASAANHFKQQILQDIELKTKPRNTPTHLSNSGTGEGYSPLTQLANNMISQTSMPLHRPTGPSPPKQSIFQTQLERPQQFQLQNQQVTPPFSRSMNLSMTLSFLSLASICNA